jgi:hypothetical protein
MRPANSIVPWLLHYSCRAGSRALWRKGGGEEAFIFTFLLFYSRIFVVVVVAESADVSLCGPCSIASRAVVVFVVVDVITGAQRDAGGRTGVIADDASHEPLWRRQPCLRRKDARERMSGAHRSAQREALAFYGLGGNAVSVSKPTQNSARARGDQGQETFVRIKEEKRDEMRCCFRREERETKPRRRRAGCVVALK